MVLAMSCSELENMLSEGGMLGTSLRERDAGNILLREEFWEYPSEREKLETSIGERNAGNIHQENSGNVTSEGWWECDIRGGILGT